MRMFVNMRLFKTSHQSGLCGIFQTTISRAFVRRENRVDCHVCSKCEWKMISIDMNDPNKNKLNCE